MTKMAIQQTDDCPNADPISIPERLVTASQPDVMATTIPITRRPRTLRSAAS